MSRVNEDWVTEDFELKNVDARRKLAPNNQAILKELNMPFVTYNSNKKLPCFNYDIVHRHCINKEGYMTKEYMQNATCRKAKQWLDQCVDLNQKYYLINKYNNEDMVKSPLVSPVQSIKDVL